VLVLGALLSSFLEEALYKCSIWMNEWMSIVAHLVESFETDQERSMAKSKQTNKTKLLRKIKKQTERYLERYKDWLTNGHIIKKTQRMEHAEREVSGQTNQLVKKFLSFWNTDVSFRASTAALQVHYYSEVLRATAWILPVSELTSRSATGNCAWRACLRFDPATFQMQGTELTTQPPRPHDGRMDGRRDGRTDWLTYRRKEVDRD